jgi:hypothetical protein
LTSVNCSELYKDKPLLFSLISHDNTVMLALACSFIAALKSYKVRFLMVTLLLSLTSMPFILAVFMIGGHPNGVM